MSAVLKAAKVMRINNAHPGVFARYHRGDPGLLGSLWSGIKGAVGGFLTGGPLGAVAGGVGGLVAGGAGAAKGGTLLTSVMGQARPQLLQDPTRPNVLSPSINIGNVGPGGAAMPPMFDGRGNTTQGGHSGTDWNSSAREVSGTACQKGYHYNKTDYFTKKYGFIPKGTVCVKNRRRNPLNPRALSRAMGRLTSAKSAAKVLNKISIRSNCGCK